MHLLKKGAPFMWDDLAQWSFHSLKKDLMLTPLLILPSYGEDSLLYLTSLESTTGMVLIQEMT